MNIWLLHVGEDLPTDPGARVFRYGHLSKALVERGHQVVRWAPTFRHTTKQQRFCEHRFAQVDTNYRVQFVHAPGYKRNISRRRLATYRTLASNFWQLSGNHQRPDAIVAAIPSLEWAEAAIAFGESCGATVAIDVRDPWPDVFLNAVPNFSRPIGRLLLRNYFRKIQDLCRRADFLTAVSQTYLDWALANAGRSISNRDQVFPIGFEPPVVEKNGQQKAFAKLSALGIDTRKPTCFFAGLFERSYDLATVIDAAQLLNDNHCELQFVLCGDGSRRKAWMRRASGLNNVFFTGWVDSDTLAAAMSFSSMGLCAYAADATQSLPNKPFEYMSGGLAVVSSLQGEMAELLKHYKCGLNYPPGDARQLAELLKSLCVDPQHLADMQTRGRNAWRESYQSAAIYRRFAIHLENHAAASKLAA